MIGWEVEGEVWRRIGPAGTEIRWSEDHCFAGGWVVWWTFLSGLSRGRLQKGCHTSWTLNYVLLCSDCKFKCSESECLRNVPFKKNVWPERCLSEVWARLSRLENQPLQRRLLVELGWMNELSSGLLIVTCLMDKERNSGMPMSQHALAQLWVLVHEHFLYKWYSVAPSRKGEKS